MRSVTLKGKGATPDSYPSEAYEIVIEAYLFFYPLIVMDMARLQFLNNGGQMNVFQHQKSYPDMASKSTSRMNLDMLESNTWLDLTKEPVILSCGDTQDRYFYLSMLDMWTDVFAAPGWRTQTSSNRNHAIVLAGWQGSLPQGMEVIVSPTPYVWVRGLIQCNGTSEYAEVNQTQKTFRIIPLSQWNGGQDIARTQSQTARDTTILLQEPVDKWPATKFFKYATELMKLHPPHNTDWSLIASMKRIGVEVGRDFNFEKLDPAVQQSLEKASAVAHKLIVDRIPSLSHVINNWSVATDILGVYGNAYLKRAVVAMANLGTNQPQDTIYLTSNSDNEDKPLKGENKYILTFTQENLPPVSAFWSLTVYDIHGFLASSSADHFTIRSKDVMNFNILGSLEIYIQHNTPGLTREANWLATPDGPFQVVLRLYAPRLAVLDGTWIPPMIKRAW